MPRIMIRSHKTPFTIVDAATTHANNLIGSNTGNLVFSQSVYRLLSTADAELSTSGLIKTDPQWLDANVDHLVIPLANAFRSGYEPSLDALSDLIETVSIPVTVLGVGAQASIHGHYKDHESVRASTTRFVRAVLDRSPSIGVRGEFTAKFLADLGFSSEHVKVIGCPSLFMYGPDHAVHRKVDALTNESPIAFNVSPYVTEMGPISHYVAEHYPHSVYLAQNIQSLELMLYGTYPMGTDKMVRRGLPVTLDHPMMRYDRARFFLDPKAWFADLAQYDFSFGTRIHGNIAALLAGTPAVLLAHDSRTLELARYHEIPFREIHDLSDPVDPAALYAEADWEPMNVGHPVRWDRFADFLAAHDLNQVYGPGGDHGRAFDETLADTPLPGPVSSLVGASVEELYGTRRQERDERIEAARLAGERKAVEAAARAAARAAAPTPEPTVALRAWRKLDRTMKKALA